jgi:hypothetical protein
VPNGDITCVDGASSSLLLTISATDMSWLHERVETAAAANTRRVPHPARLVRQGGQGYDIMQQVKAIGP